MATDMFIPPFAVHLLFDPQATHSKVTSSNIGIWIQAPQDAGQALCITSSMGAHSSDRPHPSLFPTLASPVRQHPPQTKKGEQLHNALLTVPPISATPSGICSASVPQIPLSRETTASPQMSHTRFWHRHRLHTSEVCLRHVQPSKTSRENPLRSDPWASPQCLAKHTDLFTESSYNPFCNSISLAVPKPRIVQDRRGHPATLHILLNTSSSRPTSHLRMIF